jgi:hypothetical protein
MVAMSSTQNPDTTQDAETLVAPVGLNLLGDANAASCCGGACTLPE